MSNGHDPIIKILSNSTTEPIHNNYTSITQLPGIVDFDAKIGFDYGDRNPGLNNNDAYFNGVEVSVVNYPGSDVVGNHRYSFSFDIDETVAENLFGGFYDVVINTANSLTSFTYYSQSEPAVKIEEVAWLEKWPSDLRLSTRIEEINVIDGGKVKILNNPNINSECAITHPLSHPYVCAIYLSPSHPIVFKNGSELELESGGGLDSRTYFKVLRFTAELGSTIKLGDHSWIFDQGGGYTTINGDLILGKEAEIITYGEFYVDKKLVLSNPGACIRVENDGKLKLNNGANLYNGGIIMADSSSTIEINGTLELDDSISGAGYALDISEGATFKMGYNSKIIVEDGAKIRAKGTAGNPVKFTYFEPTWDDANAWSGIEMRGDGNVFKHTIVEGAIGQGLYFRSDDNLVEYSNIRDNIGYGIRTYYDYSGGWGSVKITDSKIENNGNHGVYVRNSYVGIEYSDIKNNSGDGIYVYYGDLGYPYYGGGYFRGNDISGNASNAVQISYSGRVHDGFYYLEGNNNFGDNISHEIYLSSYNAQWWDAILGGYSAVLDNNSSTKYVYNLAQTSSGENAVSWTVGVENYAWNYATPSWSKFYGSVDYTPYQTGQMFGSVGPRGVVPSSFNLGNITQFTGKNILSNTQIEQITSSLDTDLERDIKLEAREELTQLLAKIREVKTNRSNTIEGEYVPRLLMGVSRYYNSFNKEERKEFTEVMPMIESFISDAHLNDNQNLSLQERLISETALMLVAHQAVLDERPVDALELITTYNERVSNIDILREIGFIEAQALEQTKHYEQAIQVYKHLGELSKRGIDPLNTTQSFQDEIMHLTELIEEDEHAQGYSKTKSNILNNDDTDTQMVDYPNGYIIEQAYPNPFNPSTIIPFKLSESGKVKMEVFDISGRLVSVLTNQNYEIGNHSIQFNATNLASGVYLIRSEILGQITTQLVTLIK